MSKRFGARSATFWVLNYYYYVFFFFFFEERLGFFPRILDYYIFDYSKFSKYSNWKLNSFFII